MKILDKYLNREYLKLYLLFALFFVAIFLLTDFFKSMGNLKKEARLWDVLQYYLLQIPYLFDLLSPLSVIISALFILTHFAGTYQIQAIQISGTSIKRTTLPLLALGAILSLILLFSSQTLTFKANQLAQNLKEENFLGPPKIEVKRNIFIHVPPSYLFYIRLFNLKEARMEDVLIYENSSPSSLTLAREGRWVEGKWIFYQGRQYLLREEIEEVSFDQKILLLDKEPEYFSKRYFPPEKMNIAELRRHIDEYWKSGFKTLDLETELNFKISYPFTNFVLLLLGIPLGLILRKGGRGASLALGLVISLGYYEMMAFFKTLGKTGVTSPFLAAWIPTLVFLLGGIYLFSRMD